MKLRLFGTDVGALNALRGRGGTAAADGVRDRQLAGACGEHWGAVVPDAGGRAIRPGGACVFQPSAGAARACEAIPRRLAVAKRVCATLKTKVAVRIAHVGGPKQARQRGRQVIPETLELARFVPVLTTFPAQEFAGADLLVRYRLRWQVNWL